MCEMNGFSTEEETPGCHNQICCLLDEGDRCTQPAGNASYNKRIQKTVAQKKLKLSIDPNVSIPVQNVCDAFFFFFNVPI